jgi:hypothetical protein
MEEILVEILQEDSTVISGKVIDKAQDGTSIFITMKTEDNKVLTIKFMKQ